MVTRFNCRHDGGMFEEEGGQYVDAQDYDDIRNFLMVCFNELKKSTDATSGVLSDIEHVALNGL